MYVTNQHFVLIILLLYVVATYVHKSMALGGEPGALIDACIHLATYH